MPRLILLTLVLLSALSALAGFIVLRLVLLRRMAPGESVAAMGRDGQGAADR